MFVLAALADALPFLLSAQLLAMQTSAPGLGDRALEDRRRSPRGRSNTEAAEEFKKIRPSTRTCRPRTWDLESHWQGSRYRSRSRHSRKGIRLAPRNAALPLQSRRRLRQAGDEGACDRCLRKAIRADPGYAPAYFNIGVIHQARARYDGPSPRIVKPSARNLNM